MILYKLCRIFFSKRQTLAAQQKRLFAIIFASTVLAFSLASHAADKLQDHKAIYAAASQFIQQETGQAAYIKPLNSGLRIMQCKAALQVDFPFNNQQTIRVRCAQTTSSKVPTWKLHLQVDLNKTLKVWRTKRPLPSGQLIEEKDVVLGTYTGHDYGQLLEQQTSPIGRYTQRAITTGKWLQKSDLSQNIRVWRAKDLIKAGTLLNASIIQPVTVSRRQTSANAVTSLNEIVGKVSRYNLAPGRTITRQDISGRQQVWVAMRNLPAGRAIVTDDLGLEWRLDYQLRQAGYAKQSQIIGLVPKSYISKGRIITTNLLRTPYLVHKNSVVKLTITTQNLRISSDAKALNNGNKGDRVAVEVLGSGKLREGIVIGKGVLELAE
ncbi:MAG: flagellar basal body P-ring formation protein FlgA [Gammaproteobacteria bacterium]|nr:flagellar basal body P-ring formation protein FlgA [Gammaproteobacteria bacterium]